MTKRWLFIAAPVLFLILVAIYFILTTSPSVRYWADDFCSATLVRNVGFWKAQTAWWNGWTGRYSYLTALDIFASIGPWVIRVLPVFIFSFLVLSALSVFRFKFLLAPFFIVLVLINAPNLIQSFYWQTGSLNYSVEFIFLNLFTSLLIWSKRKRTWVLAFLLPLIAGGFSEAYALVQVVLILFFIAIIFVGDFKNKKARLRLAFAGLVGAILSIVIMLAAPGNAARGLTVTQPASVGFVIKSTIYGTRWYLQRMLMVKPFIYSLLLASSVVLVITREKWNLFKKFYFGKKKMVEIMLLAIISAVVSTAAVISSGYYAMSITPPERTMFVAIYSIFVSFFVFCFSGSILLLKNLKAKYTEKLLWVVTIVGIIISLLLIRSTVTHWTGIRNQLSEYAREWDKEERVLLKAAGDGNTVAIKNIKPVGELDGFVENKGWVTSCVAGFYEVNVEIEE